MLNNYKVKQLLSSNVYGDINKEKNKVDKQYKSK